MGEEDIHLDQSLHQSQALGHHHNALAKTSREGNPGCRLIGRTGEQFVDWPKPLRV